MTSPAVAPLLEERYPTLRNYTRPVESPNREIVGREKEVTQVLVSLHRPELSNVILLGAAGTGKTAVVQAVSLADEEHDYLEVDLALMIAGLRTSDEMAARLKELFNEAERYTRDEARPLVLFIDEFHQIVQMSRAAVEALKPVLAASGTRGIRIIAATTYEEFHDNIRPNQALVERLQRINLSPPDEDTTVQILRGLAERYGVIDEVGSDNTLFHLIYEFTERYVPSSVQPRKSILVLDSMVGWHRFTGARMGRDLLARVLQESLGVDVAFNVDATAIKQVLDTRVFSQDFASRVIAKRLQICVADLHDKTKPMSSFLFTGSSAVGKTEMTKQLARLLFGDDTQHLIRFDMSEFALDNSLEIFKSELTQKVWSMGHALILFDEIEKASSVITRLLLQVLDDGRLTDDNGRQVSFLNCYIVLTTNAASEIYQTIAQYSPDDDGSGKEMTKRMKEIRRSLSETQGENKFPPELLGRIDAIVPFQPLSLETQRRIITRKLKNLRDEVMNKRGVQLTFDRRVLLYLVDDRVDTDSDGGGARAAVSTMNDEVVAAVSAFVNQYPEIKRVTVDVEGELRSENKNRLDSTAYISVAASVAS